jgi:hypothetical protein
MTILLLSAVLAIAGMGAWMNRRWPVWGQATIALGILGLVGVVIVQVRQNILPPQPKASGRCEIAVSYGLANCLLGDVSDQGGTVVLLFPQRRNMDENTERSYEDGFVPALRHGRIKLNLKAVRLKGENGDLAAFKEALAQDPEAAAIISYAGMPAGCEALFPTGQQQKPLVYVYDSEKTTRWLGALKEGRIRAVVVPRPGADLRGREKAAGMPEAIFEKYYLLATAANADEVAAGQK